MTSRRTAAYSVAMISTRIRTVVALLAFASLSAVTAPARAADESATKPVEKPPIVSREEWGSKPQPIPDDRKHTPTYLTIHHAGVVWAGKSTPEQFLRNMQGWGQREKKWPDLAYHFLIAPDGKVYEGRDLAYEPETNTKYEISGHVNVELMGNFEEQRMSPAQLESLVKVCAWLGQELNIDPSQIGGHNDRAPGQTSCPGKDLYRYIEDGSIAKWVGELREGKTPAIEYKEPLENGPVGLVQPIPFRCSSSGWPQ